MRQNNNDHRYSPTINTLKSLLYGNAGITNETNTTMSKQETQNLKRTNPTESEMLRSGASEGRVSIS